MSHTKDSRRLALAVISGAGTLCASGAVVVQSSSDDVLQEVVVTATKQAEPLSKVPISVAAFTAEAMDRQGVRSIQDIATLTPGLTFSRDTFGSGTPAPHAGRLLPTHPDQMTQVLCSTRRWAKASASAPRIACSAAPCESTRARI